MNIQDEALKARTICYKPIDPQYFAVEVMRAVVKKIVSDVRQEFIKKENERDNQITDNNDTHTAAH